MRVVGLFAGVGGLERGFEQAGHEAHLLCEYWEPAKAVLEENFKNVPLSGDVIELVSLPGDTDILTAGFPCQDLSQAGLTKGIRGSKSSLVSHVFRLIDGSFPPLVVLENVSFMLRLDGGRAMADLVHAFEERGYRWAYRVVNSLGFLPQRRERVFLVASKCDVEPASVLFADEAIPQIRKTSLSTHAHGFYWTEGSRGLGWAPDAIPPLKNGSTVGIPSQPAIMMPDGTVIKPGLADAERLQGFPTGWTKAAEKVGRASFRWSLIGNAVTVPVARWLGDRLQAPGDYDLSRDVGLPKGAKWPRAARSSPGGPVHVQINDFPIFEHRPPLHRFLEGPGQELSARATRGFLNRAEKGNLRFVPGFLDGLRNHLATIEASALAAE